MDSGQGAYVLFSREAMSESQTTVLHGRGPLSPKKGNCPLHPPLPEVPTPSLSTGLPPGFKPTRAGTVWIPGKADVAAKKYLLKVTLANPSSKQNFSMKISVKLKNSWIR